MNMALETNQELTKEIASLKEVLLDVISKHFTRERTQAIKSNFVNSNLIDKTNNFDFTVWKKNHLRILSLESDRNFMVIINKIDKSCETLRMVE